MSAARIFFYVQHLLGIGHQRRGATLTRAMQDITFSACGNTMKKVASKTGNMPKLLEGVGQVTAGVARIMELQQQGYAYIRP